MCKEGDSIISGGINMGTDPVWSALAHGSELLLFESEKGPPVSIIVEVWSVGNHNADTATRHPAAITSHSVEGGDLLGRATINFEDDGEGVFFCGDTQLK